MTRRVRRLRVLIEGVVIVGSILLAFGIDAWWERVQERESAEQYRLALIGDASVRRSVVEYYDHLEYWTESERSWPGTIRDGIRTVAGESSAPSSTATGRRVTAGIFRV